MGTISVLVADDHAIVRAGFVALLGREPGIEVVAEVGDGDAAIQRIAALRPSVAVLDIAMPGMTGIEAARQIRDSGSRTAVILLSIHREPSFVRAALDAGASGYLLKDCATSELLEAVRAAAAGDVYLCTRIASTAIAVLRAGPPKEEPELTPRERDVLRLLARGLSSKEIATKLAIGTRTVESYRAAIMDKLGIRNVPGLVKWAIKHQLSSLDEEPAD